MFKANAFATKDVEYVLSFCLETHTDTLEATERLLEYASQRSMTLGLPDGGNGGNVETVAIVNQIHDTTRRFATWKIVHTVDVAEQPALISKNNFALAWHDFRTSTLADNMRLCLSQGRVAAAAVIWRRHSKGKLR
jgi:hypothetical protein